MFTCLLEVIFDSAPDQFPIKKSTGEGRTAQVAYANAMLHVEASVISVISTTITNPEGVSRTAATWNF